MHLSQLLKSTLKIFLTLIGLQFRKQQETVLRKSMKSLTFHSYQEFLEQTKKPDFEQDNGWQGIDEQQIYSEQEYEAYERRRQEEIQKMIAKGIVRIRLLRAT